MFAKSILAALSVVAVISSGAVAKPIAAELTRRTDNVQVVPPSQSFSPPSFNNYMGLSTMNNFDDFFGQDNFNSVFNEQTIIVQQESLVCSSIDIQFVQQRLSILIEVAKNIILQQVCEVEVQTIVLQQFQSVVSTFGSDLSRSSDRQLGFDQNVANMYNQIFSSDGSLSSNDLGFLGSNLGSNTRLVGGSNWNDDSSPASVSSAKTLAMEASNCTVSSNNSNSTSSSNSTDSSS